MMEILMFCCVHRTKFRRKPCLFYILIVLIIVVSLQICVKQAESSSVPCNEVHCAHGVCKEGRCVCEQGWQGSGCQSCGGRVRLTEPYGYITDGPGNYSVDMQCTWFIDSGLPNNTIRLEIVHFETECSWDHLYVFDGDSVFSPLVAAYSGVLMKNGANSERLPEIVAHSGSAYLYFYSDAAYNMSGLNISYSVNSCPRNCSGHGPCVDGICTCWAGWIGEACDISICPPKCTENGYCDGEHHKCICNEGYTGFDCSYHMDEGWWEEYGSSEGIEGRALHQAILIGDAMWVLGGENFHKNNFQDLIMFNFLTNKWEQVPVTSTVKPPNRYGHSVVIYMDNLYMYGGMLHNDTVVDELWMFSPSQHTWTHLKTNVEQDCHTELCSPLAIMGHTATVVGNSMIVIFGHNSMYGYLNTVQQYDFGFGTWELVETKGAIVKGGYGHTSVYDRVTQRIYVYGGYHSYSNEASLVDLLYSYNPWEHTWVLLTPSQSFRYLHSSVILNGLMLVFGGNTHNGTSFINGDQCFSADFLAYDIACDTWHIVNFPSASGRNIARFGHTAVMYSGSMYVFGGFNGQMLNDIQKLTPGSCKNYPNSTACEKATPGVKCMWNFEKGECHAFSSSVSHVAAYHTCSRKAANLTSLCGRLTSCPSCVENTYGCVWCDTLCAHGRCPQNKKETNNLEECEEAQSSNCDKLHNCHACHTEYHCGWQTDDKCYTFARETGNRTEKAVLSEDYRAKCELPCSSRVTCENCTQGPCMWCSNKKLCIESNAYAAIFPIAQCMEWANQLWKCAGLLCKDIQTCDQCQKNPRCGWCDDGSGTGLGMCLEGSASGPVVWNGSSYIPSNSVCPVGQWYFTSCPVCQCNGHSTCVNDSDKCLMPCQHFTEGSHCQQCLHGYYGNPVNGGNCTPCFCNNHGELCHRESGRCYCTTKGIVGGHCNKCDETNHYIGNPEEEGGSCFYNLSVDFQYTFNMSKPEDHYYTNINFMNVPAKPDIDVDFSISCTVTAYVNISVASASTPERVLRENFKCGKVKIKFPHDEHIFGVDNTTFYVFVFGFNTPFVLEISFSQHRTLDLLQFFITFSSCFLSLLIIAAILWKIKQKYDLYRRRQRLFVEMEQMASRPFAGVVIELQRQTETISAPSEDGRKKCHPTPIALEPCSGGKAAVLSLIVRMPSGEEEYTLAGQSGLAIASALVSLGTLCKGNTEAVKESGKIDSWKSSSNSSTCI